MDLRKNIFNIIPNVFFKKSLTFFRPSTLDAYVFGFLAPLYKVRFPKVQLQEHLKQLSNLCRFCDDILNSYFRLSLGGKLAPLQLICVCVEYLRIFQWTYKQNS